MDNTRTLYGEIVDIIKKETLFLRHYWGKVVNIDDPKKKGRVKVTVEYLGLDTEDLALWCWPRYVNSFTTPKVDDMVEIYFMNADPDWPVYLGKATEFHNQLPENYDKKASSHVIFESPKRKDVIKQDDEEGILDILMIEKKNGILNIKVGGSGKINIEAKNAGIINILPGTGGKVNLGSTAAVAVNNFPACLFTGVVHSSNVECDA